MTAALGGGEWSAARSGRTLPPVKTRYPFYRRLGGPQGRSGRSENLVPVGIQYRTVQPVAQSLYRLSYRPTNDYVVQGNCEKSRHLELRETVKIQSIVGFCFHSESNLGSRGNREILQPLRNIGPNNK